MKKLFWLSCAAAAVSLLLMSGAVFAEGGEPPAAAPECVDCGSPALTEAPADDPAVVGNTPDSDLQYINLDEDDPAEASVEGTEPEPSGDPQASAAQVTSDEKAPDAAEELEIVLLNAQGEPLDMASQETAEVMALPDPYFFIGGVRHSHSSLSDALTDITNLNKLPDLGIIYYENGTYSEAINIDGVGSILSGLKGIVSENGSEFTIINNNVTLNGLTAGFTLKGFTINGVVSIVNNTGAIVLEDLDVSNPAGIGIVIGSEASTHKGSATLKNVKSHHNSSHGATIFADGNISVTNSSLNFNGTDTTPGDGLWVESSAGTITIQDVITAENTGIGIRSEEFKKGATLKRVVANVNGSGGISLLKGAGSILLEDLEASGNSGTGIVIGEKNTFHIGAITLRNVKVNENPISNGATIFATGNIAVSNSSFDDNGGNGLRVESSAGSITLKGITASLNDARGIYNLNAFTKTFTLQHVQANNNGLHGLDLGFSHSTLGTATGAFIADTVYLRNNNTSGTTTPPIEGFKLTTNGAVTLKNILIEGTTNGSGLNLLHYSTTPVLLQNVISRGNGKIGLSIGTRGNVSLTSVKSTDNGTDGTRITNWGPDGIGTITITSPASAGTAGANDFSSNDGIGLYLASNKNITLANLDVSKNGLDGLVAITAGNLAISKTLPNWINGFNGNEGGSGILSRAEGNVSLGYCEASGNANSGGYFNITAKSATVIGGRFDNNGDNGLYIKVSGNVLLADIESASNNDWDASGDYEGIKIEGATNVTLKNASKTASTAIGGNSGNGLSIISTGSVSITGVNAWSNGGDGLDISNRVWPYGKPVTLSRIESIFNTAGNGINVYTAGSVSMQDIFTAENSAHGLQIDACVTDGFGGCLNIANVTLKGSNNAFSNNAGAGLDISTKGSVNLSHLDVYGNDAGGVKIFNALNGTSPVTIGGKVSSKIDANMNYGLWVESRGAITVKNLIVQNTTEFGYGPNGAVHLSNKGPAKMGVTLSDVEIINNEQTGLFINTDGLVSLLGVTSSYNSITSGWIDEDNSTNGVRERLSGYWENEDRWHFNGESGDTYTITLTSSAFAPMLVLEDASGMILNADENLDGNGTAAIALTLLSDGEYVLRVQSRDWGMGVYQLTFGGGIYDALNNHPFSGAAIYTPMSVKVSSSKTMFSSFDGNNGDGLYVSIDSSGLGSVSLTNAGADNNNYNGVSILAPNGNVSLSNNHARVSGFSWNGFQGVKIVSGGAITLNNRLLAIGNGREGFYLDNHSALAAKAITIKNVQAWFNGRTGLTANSLGSISVTSLDASGNGENGASLSTLGNVVLLGSNVFSGNHEQGLYVAASGIVSINGVLAEGNDGVGLDIQSNGIGKTVLVKNTLLRFNGDTGLVVNAQGAVTLDYVQSVLNDGSGVDLNDNGVAVLIKNSVMMGNGGNGLRVEQGLYSLVNSLYYGNSSQNIYLYYHD